MAKTDGSATPTQGTTRQRIERITKAQKQKMKRLHPIPGGQGAAPDAPLGRTDGQAGAKGKAGAKPATPLPSGPQRI